MKKRLIVAIITIVVVMLVRSAARGALHFCNATPQPISVAIVTQELLPKPTNGIYRGLYRIAAGECRAPLAETPETVAVFMRYAEQSTNTTWLEETAIQHFEINGEFKPFHRINPTHADATVVFLAPDAALIF